MRRSILTLTALLLVLGLVLGAGAGCKKLNSAYCDETSSPCASGRKCDLVAKECVDATADLGPDAAIQDLAGAPDFSGVDLAGADFAAPDLATLVDMTPPVDLIGADLAGCAGKVCTPGGAGNSYCKTQCGTGTAKCAPNGLCIP
ncbi:MAG TPA: hypothetical protein VMZ28_08965 [Kofleriaceae bacterium]|nr:hypothetical protein [Kofleriaceae bacterium]